MSVVAAVAAAAVGPTPVAPTPALPYGLCAGGARKRKDVVHLQEEVEEEEGQGGEGGGGSGHGLFVLETVEEEEEREAEAEAETEKGNNERSSIGPVSDGEVEEGDEAESQETPPWQRRRKKHGGLASLDALEDALPVKRGLSSFFSGKSRSFANLQEVAGSTRSSKDVLAKPENPFNKRRRILRCCSIRRVSSTSLTALPLSWRRPSRPSTSETTVSSTAVAPAPAPASAVADRSTMIYTEGIDRFVGDVCIRGKN